MKVKTPPLLNPPPNATQPWMTVDEGKVDDVMQTLDANWERLDSSLIGHAKRLHILGYDVKKKVLENEKTIRSGIMDRGRDGNFTNFLFMTSAMACMGFDVEKEIKENTPELTKFFDKKAFQKNDHWTITYLAQAKESGFDISRWYKDGSIHLLTRKVDLRKYYEEENTPLLGKILLAKAMKTLGVDVTDKLEKDKEKIVNAIKLESSTEYIRNLAMLKQLGLLNPKYERQTPQIPPLKEVTK